MELNREALLGRIRQIALDTGVERVTVDRLCLKLGISKDTLFTYFQDEKDLMAKVLEYEREQFALLLSEANFEGKNAIDVLLTVSVDMANKFDLISPRVTSGLSKYYPKIYEEHIDERMKYIFDKIKLNLMQGIDEGVYRSDLHPELISRLYISRLVDVMNPELFPRSEFSFDVVFNQMIEIFLRGITTDKGLDYFMKKRHIVKLK